MGQSPATPAEPRIPVYQPVFLGSLAFVLVNFLLPVYTRQLGPSTRAALGTVVGLLVGAVAKVGLGLAMVALFVYWVTW